MISYKDSGVDKEEGYRAVTKMKEAVSRTHNSSVLANLGSFGSLFELGVYKNPVLVSGTDGVGTKLDIAFKTKKYDTVGQDCFAMCANDILCHGAKPLFFLDYLACGELDADVAAELVTGIARAAEECGCALVGGETAEMPGFYKPGDYDMAGFCVGAVEKEKIVNGSRIEEGDVIIALPSNGLHSNGFSLVRKLFPDYFEEWQGKPIYEELLKPTRVYVSQVLPLLEKYDIKGMAHITGGGMIENIPRIFPEGIYPEINQEAIPFLPIYDEIEKRGVKRQEMLGTFNMGVGLVLVVPEFELNVICQDLKDAFIIGKAVKGAEEICFV